MSRSFEQRWQRAQDYLARMEPAPARAQLEAMRAQAPQDIRTHLLASQIAWRDDRVRDATRHALDALQVVPDDAELLCQTIEALLHVGETVAARVCLARRALAEASTPGLCVRLADYTQRLNENVASLAWLERAMAAGANDPETKFHYGAQLYFHGRFDEAAAALEHCLRIVPEHGRAAFTLAALRAQTLESNHLDQFATGLARVAKGSMNHAALEFARYKELEDMGRYGEAWTTLANANAIMHARNPFDVDAHAAFLDRLLAACDESLLWPRAADAQGPRPIFILGLPRSGTTLLERMLANHTQIQSAGELVDFGAQLQWSADTHYTHDDAFLERLATLDFRELGHRYLVQTQWRARGKAFFIDKQPPNWELSGMIHAALPQARILHLVRDPMDVCFSNWRAFFGDGYGYRYSYDMRALGVWHGAYRRTMEHWRRIAPDAMLDVRYAELTADPETVVRKVLDYCGLEFEPACLEARGDQAPVMTLSAAQVREPVHNRASGQWRRYQSQLQLLQTVLMDHEKPVRD